MKNKNILWIGPIVNKKYLNSYKALSPAANYWQLNFVNSLIANKFDITLATYVPEQSWPIGPFWVKYPDSITLEIGSVKFTNYLNLPLIRDIWIAITLFLSLIKFNNFNLVITYNPILRHKLLAKISRLYFKSKWISILADDLISGNPDKTIFLSYKYFTKTTFTNKYYFEGGINNIFLPIKNKSNIIIYAGSITKWTGIEDFVIFFNSFKNDINFELHIYGKGDSDIIKYYESINKNIKFFGFVDDEILINQCKNAFAFINPRPLKVINGDNNFPSKILFYLEFLKPIISTNTKGLSNDLINILNIYNPELTDDFKTLLINLTNNEYYENVVKQLSIYAKLNTWNIKVENLMNKILKDA